MIESKEQLISSFREKVQAFLASPGPLTGIDLDDASVALKRYALSAMHDQQLGSLLGRFQKLIRQLDLETLSGLIREVEDRLKE